MDEDVDEEELSGLINGSIKLNETDLHVLPASKFPLISCKTGMFHFRKEKT